MIRAESAHVPATPIAVEIEIADVTNIKVDLLAVKSGPQLYGASLAVVRAMNLDSASERKIAQELVLLEAGGQLGVARVLFQPAPPLTHFDYRDARKFARDILVNAAHLAPESESIAITLHGPGFGLDEREAFEAEIGGLVESINLGQYPPPLRKIVFAERSKERAGRLREFLQELLPRGIARRSSRAIGKATRARAPLTKPSTIEAASLQRLRSAGVTSRDKPLVFVAMPFADEVSDVFDYGIKNAVKQGLGRDVLCERADLAAYVGDVMQYVRERIAGAALVIGDLTGANANVYLEVGFAWGCKKPTVLLVKESSEEIKFDVRGQRYLKYKSIKDLETKLTSELKGLKPQLLET